MKLTPMMRQYKETKAKYPDCLLMFRVGDFFELFFDDAVIAARELNIALTSRDKKEGEEGTPMAGVPHHALDAYLGKLVKRGYKIAICDQVEDPQLAKGLVKREVVRVVTPGTIIEDNLLEPTENNWLLALVQDKGEWGLAFIDISTGQFRCSQFSGSREQVESILASLNPRELVSDQKSDSLGFSVNSLLSPISPHQVMGVSASLPADHFLQGKNLAAKAVAIILAYLQERHMAAPKPLEELEWYDPARFMYLDATSQRNLEVLAPLGGSNGPSLLKVVDRTVTAMGSRMLKNILIAPLADAQAIERRLDSVQFFYDNYVLRQKARELLREIYDLERIITKIKYKSANARDMLALAHSLELIPALHELVADIPGGTQHLGDYSPLCTLITKAIQAEPPVTLREGNIIRPGYSQELDEIRQLAASGSDWIRKYEGRLREETGIKSLKIGFNKVFGYYIEVTRTHLDLVPSWFIRKQTLVNCERYETRELKEWEDKILSAQERKQNLEYQLFCALRDEVATWSSRIQATARSLAALDCWQGLADTAAEYNYCRPIIDDSTVLDIRDGRHPVVEQFGSVQFVANDCLLDTHQRQIMIITGPNMAGKSTYMRQVALIALLAQAGSFVPAAYARIGVLDAIFTRIGASDELASGRSTFMVEMAELARILAKATPRSLILLDEIGRGTGTADGISIARATLEYLHNKPALTAKTLFATHYHQLTILEQELNRVINCSIQVSEKEGEVTFLYKIVPGGSDRSYGIHVAKLAGLPEELVAKAKRYVAQEFGGLAMEVPVAATREQIPAQVESILRLLQSLNLDDISPRQAWTELDRLVRLAAEVSRNED